MAKKAKTSKSAKGPARPNLTKSRLKAAKKGLSKGAARAARPPKTEKLKTKTSAKSGLKNRTRHMLRTSLKGVRRGVHETVSNIRHSLDKPATGLGDLKILATRVLERAKEISQSLKNQKPAADESIPKKKI